MNKKYKQIIIGIDQSYTRTGLSLISESKVIDSKCIELSKLKDNSSRRMKLKANIEKVLKLTLVASEDVVIIIERIRLQSQGSININYIKSVGALNAMIVDIAKEYNVKVFSVDTRSWKARVVGNVKPLKNKYGVPDEKWPTIKYMLNKGYKKYIMHEVTNKRKKKGTFIASDGLKYEFINDIADSMAIGLYWFYGPHELLVEEH
jgi:hypothetical protein